MKKKQIKKDLIDLEINLEVLIAEKKENKKQTVSLNSRISELKSKLEIKECGYYIQYADGTTSKIGQPKKFKRSNPSIKKTKECLDYYDKLMSVLRPTVDVDQKIIDKLKTKEYIEFEIASGDMFTINNSLLKFISAHRTCGSNTIKVKAKRIL